jgi:hypothetical protein
MLRVICALVIVSLGCGLTQVKGPVANSPPNVRPECTTSDRSLKIDASFGATGVFVALMGGLLYKVESSDKDVLDVVIIGGLSLTVAMLVSSGIGYSKVKKCRKAVEDFDRANPPPPYQPSPQQQQQPSPQQQP